MLKFKAVLLACMLLSVATSCVQKTVEKTVLVQVLVHGKTGIEKLGIRGEGNPLSWYEDRLLQPVVADSLYETSFISKTGFLYTEYKFTLNGDFEWEDGPARRIYYNQPGDTIFIKAEFGRHE
ncbi:MAG: hypothetical protein ACK4E0_10075 [Chitinophagaceae bacterium]